jgi:hypothetical protein
MVNPLFLKASGTRGPKRKPSNNPKTVANRKWEQNCLARILDGKNARAEVRRIPLRRTYYQPVADRKRGKIINNDDLLSLYQLRHRCYATTRGFASARGNVGVYTDRLRVLQVYLRKDLDIRTYRMGAMVNPKQVLGTYLHLVERSGLLWGGDYTPRLALFMDACRMFNREDSNLISCFLPQARHPHQQLLNVALCRFIGYDCAFNYKVMFRAMGLVKALQWVMQRGINGRGVLFVLYVDWKCLCMVLGWVGPGDELCCPFCWATKTQWKLLGFMGAALRTQADWMDTPFRDLLALFQDVDDVGHCTLHNTALCLTHGVIHAVLLWARANLPRAVSDALLLFFGRYCPGDNPYRPPEQDNILLDDWALNGKTTKMVLRDDDFWTELGSIIPRMGQPYGFTVQHSLLNSGTPMANPLHTYLELLRALMLDTISFRPHFVHDREDICLQVHRLYFACGLPRGRYNCAMHIQLWHYASRLRRHGNLVSANSEGGEKHHQPHKRIAGTDSTFVWGRCPPAIKRCLTWSTDNLALWRARRVHPDRSALEKPVLPSN